MGEVAQEYNVAQYLDELDIDNNAEYQVDKGITETNEEKIIWLIQKAFDFDQKEAKLYANRFFKRFYTQQFKRQTLPEGPKILGISLSPRGQYRMPSDVIRK